MSPDNQLNQPEQRHIEENMDSGNSFSASVSLIISN